MTNSNVTYLDPERIAARGDKPMTVPERLDEAEWLLNGGVHPTVVAAQLGVPLRSLERTANRYGRADLARRLNTDELRHLSQRQGATSMYASVA